MSTLWSTLAPTCYLFRAGSFLITCIVYIIIKIFTTKIQKVRKPVTEVSGTWIGCTTTKIQKVRKPYIVTEIAYLSCTTTKIQKVRKLVRFII